ncbi:MAG: winged helix-turn-helix transcriptional regulator [Deltaproteobacteria bacterium]|nr:winged helix-turn-helix transcriptional regulator [Deltaproteobacteria bacterium]
MLQYLVTSKVRRRLLSLLWGEKHRGSVAELAHLAGVAFAGAHTELKAMQRAQLVVSHHDGGKQVYSANVEHPDAATLQALVASAARPVMPERSEDERLKRKLVALGAPLRGLEPLEVSPSEQLTTLLEGARLARRDAVVARCLPLCFWNVRESVTVKAFEALSLHAEDKHTLGFFLELTGELGGDRRLLGLAESLRDRRMTALREFFQTGRREATREFDLATRWGFRMNMDMDSFQSLFSKFTR